LSHQRRIYCSKSEIDQANKYFLELIKNKPQEIIKIYADSLNKEKEIEKMIEEIISNKITIGKDNFSQISRLFKENFLYCTAIPFYLLSAVNFSLENGGKEEDYAEIIDKFSEFRSKTNNYRFIEAFLPIIMINGQAQNISQDLIPFCTIEEMARFFNNENVDKFSLLNRNTCMVYFEGVEEAKFNFDSEIINKINFANVSDKISNLSGKSGYPGKVIGKAKIVRNSADMQGFEEGNIVITPNANPDIIFVLEKAGAIVSDEGGIMCHAFILAREFKKPCIVGTEIATKIIKDNMLIEVDATNGIVKILEDFI